MSIIMAHRGARNLWAENSLLGFRRVIEAGFTAVEFDLHLTDDGTLVVMHDATLERTTNATGPTRALSDASRKEVRLKDESGAVSDEYVPSFDEVLDLFAPHPEIILYVELKADEAYRPYAGMVAKITAALDARGMSKRAWLHSFDIDVVRELRDQAPAYPRMISVNHEWAEKQGGLAALLDNVDDLVDVVGIHHALFDAETDLVKSRLGMDRVSLWTLNSTEVMLRMAAHKPMFLVSDDPLLLRQTLAKAAQQ